MNALIANSTLAQHADQWLRDIWFKPGNSNLTAEVDWMFMFILWVSIISFIILMVPMTYWAIRYKRRPGVAQQRTPNHNLFLEVTWVVVPLMLMTYMFFKGFHGYMDGQIVPGNAEEINVTAKKWIFSAVYNNGATSPVTVRFDVKKGPGGSGGEIRMGNVDVPLWVIPEGRPVKFKMKSDDVIHALFFPDMRIKNDIMPNRYTSFGFTAETIKGPDGVTDAAIVDTKTSQIQTLKDLKLRDDKKDGPSRDHIIYCAEYCGTNHSEMAGVLRVVSVEDYEQIKKDWGNLDKIMGEDPVKLGQIISKAKGCNACHSIDGKAGTGPSWLNTYGNPVEFDAGAKGIDFDAEFKKDKFNAWDNYIRESILRPKEKIHKGYAAGNMPAYDGQISEIQIQGVIAYFRSMSDTWKATQKPPGKDFQDNYLKAEEEKKNKK